ncbi:hypothetical protein EYF80_037405 [Liparis tanakae]|uniref:Uncharacterized protein n=1 Tax=Liparis tanakae TaxID=230148 RepID=A0A4Z2GI69_9TELE|nr:hypothetical protein EYF80_037405 [Liparis tanakae]
MKEMITASTEQSNRDKPRPLSHANDAIKPQIDERAQRIYLVVNFISSRLCLCASVPTAPLWGQTHAPTHTLAPAGLINNQPPAEANYTWSQDRSHPRSTHSAAEPKHTPLPHAQLILFIQYIL